MRTKSPGLSRPVRLYSTGTVTRVEPALTEAVTIFWGAGSHRAKSGAPVKSQATSNLPLMGPRYASPFFL